MSNRFTTEQTAAIEACGKTIVSASAGSGKTTVMIEKIVRLIKSGERVDSILAVTFTKKAASQMKEKLSKELIEEINKPDCPKEKQNLLKGQLAEVPSADISTIHSFCAKLIRTHFFAAETDNAFRVIAAEDAEGTALKNQALDELFDEGYEQKEEDFSHLLSVYWRKKSDNALRTIFHETYEQLRIRADYREYLEKTQAGYTEGDFEEVAKDLKARFDEKCGYYLDLLEDEQIFFQTEEEKNAGSAKSQLALVNELSAWLIELSSAPDYFAASQVLKPKFTANRSNKKDSSLKAEHGKRLSFLKERIVKACTLSLRTREEELTAFLRSGKTAAALAKYLLRFDEKYADLKRERGVLDYNDLEHKALSLLSSQEIVAEMREKYKYVFVDEYQDVNPVQESIVSLLSGENLFLVGDVKQAIYGFRGSKSRFFAEKQKEFEKGAGKNLFLTRNFRSSDCVLDLVNSQFSLLMTPKVCAVDYARDSFMERGGRYEVNSGKAEIHFFGKEEKQAPQRRGVYSVKEKTEKKRAEESRIAKLIRSIIEKERSSKYYDPDSGEWKQVRYGDIAILSRKKQGQIAKSVASLSEQGIPVTAVAAVNICEYAEIKTLIDILQLLDNAEQDIPLCSALLSSMGNMTADELTEIRLAYPTEKWFRAACKGYALEKNDKIAYKLGQFYEYFEEVRKLCTVLDAGEILTKILSETRMETGFLSRENGIACVRRVHRFIEEAAGESLCVRAFLQKLKDLEFKIEYSENGGEDSVKVLTMHASKGLEYPIVIVDNLSADFTGGGREEVFVEEKYGLAPRAFDEKKMLKSGTLLRRLYEEKEEESSLADALNLYYVALTRAKYGIHLLFEERTVMADPKYARSFADLTDFSIWEKYFVYEDFLELPKQERTAFVFHPDEELTRKIMQAFTRKYPFTGYEDLPVKSSATRLLTTSEETENSRSIQKQEILSEMESEGETNTKIGLAYHAFLERFDFSALYDGAGMRLTKEKLKKCVASAYEKSPEKDLLSVEKLVEILSNPVFYSLRGKKLYKERQFLVSLPVQDTYAKKEEFSHLQNREDGEEMLFQGAIDLLAEGEEEIQIIDYKYSKGGAEYLKEHYKPQLDLYKKAVAKIMKTDEGKIRCRIVNIYHGFEVNMD